MPDFRSNKFSSDFTKMNREEKIMQEAIPGREENQRDQQKDGREGWEDTGAKKTPPGQPMAAVRRRTPRRGVVIAIRHPLAVITAISCCNSELAVRYCSGYLAGPGESGFALPSAARQEDSTSLSPATQEDPVTGSVGYTSGTGGPIARHRPANHGNRQDYTGQTSATKDRLDSSRAC